MRQHLQQYLFSQNKCYLFVFSYFLNTLFNIVGGYRIDSPVSIRMLHMSAMAAINYNSSGQQNCDISFDMHNKWSISILNQHWVKWQAYYAEHKTNKESLIQNIGYEFQMSFQFPKVSWMPLTERLCIKCHWILTFVFAGWESIFCFVLLAFCHLCFVPMQFLIFVLLRTIHLLSYISTRQGRCCRPGIWYFVSRSFYEWSR